VNLKFCAAPFLIVVAMMMASSCTLHRAADADTRVVIAGRQVDIWRPSNPGPAPLVVFSHGFHGCGSQSKFLTRALAEDGYFVVAPNHADAACSDLAKWRDRPEESFRSPQNWTDATYRDRADDIRAVLDALHRDPAYAGRIDWTRIALVGHSLGGYTALALAGGWPSWRLANVRAVLALSPACAPLAEHGALGMLGVPVEYQGGSRDYAVTPQIRRPQGCYDQTASPATYIEFQGAGHFAWTDLQPRFHRAIIAYSLAFLDERMKSQQTPPPSRDQVSDLREK